MRRAAVVTAVAGLLLTAACGADTPKGAPPSPKSGTPGTPGETTATTTAISPTGPSPTIDTNYLPVPSGVSLTTQGARLKLGDAALVAWVPKQNVVAAAKVKVMRVQTAPLTLLDQWNLPPAMQTASLFFVSTSVRNVGTSDLGDLALPVYAATPANELVQSSTFAGDFKPCPSGRLPKPFPVGVKKKVCLLYLVPKPGKVSSVTFRPSQDFNPITWKGKVTAYGQKTTKKKS